MSNRLSLTLLAASAVIAPIAMIATACATTAIDTHSDLTRHACTDPVVTVDAHTSTACDLDGSQQLNLTWEGADGYDDAWVRQEAADMGCRLFMVINHVATGLDCDY